MPFLLYTNKIGLLIFMFFRPDTGHIFVDVGLGFHVEFTWSEALKFIAAREAKLTRHIEDYTQLIASNKVQIMMWR